MAKDLNKENPSSSRHVKPSGLPVGPYVIPGTIDQPQIDPSTGALITKSSGPPLPPSGNNVVPGSGR